jgi:putative ABC transport system ATP-binding protein
VPLIYARKLGVAKAARRALEKVGLGSRTDHKPNQLSGGERQRVAIARAIVNEPKLILADEPTGNLDSKNGEQILQIFEALNAEGVTVVLVTHEMTVAARAKRLIRMIDGKVIEDRAIDAKLRAELLQHSPTEPVVMARPAH